MTVAEVEHIGAPDITTADAKAAYLSYRAELLRERNPTIRAELGTLARSYRAIARGRNVVDVDKAIKGAGLQPETHYPRLAICRADATWCHLDLKEEGSATFSTRKLPWNNRIAANQAVRLPAGTFERFSFNHDKDRGPVGWSNRPRGWQRSAKALVPVVPPQYRPAHSLAGYHILWDAVWTPNPPVDPLLLKHLGGPLYALMAAWDLTPLERAVMRGRL